MVKNPKKKFLINISKPIRLSLKNTPKTVFEKNLAALYKNLFKFSPLFSKSDKTISKSHFSKIFVVLSKKFFKVFVWQMMSHHNVRNPVETFENYRTVGHFRSTNASLNLYFEFFYLSPSTAGGVVCLAYDDI